MANTLTSQVFVNWRKRRPKFYHGYACVGHLLSPNPTIQNAVKTMTMQEDLEVCEYLIFKLPIPPNMVGKEKTELKAQLVKD